MKYSMLVLYPHSTVDLSHLGKGVCRTALGTGRVSGFLERHVLREATDEWQFLLLCT